MLFIHIFYWQRLFFTWRTSIHFYCTIYWQPFNSIIIFPTTPWRQSPGSSNAVVNILAQHGPQPVLSISWHPPPRQWYILSKPGQCHSNWYFDCWWYQVLFSHDIDCPTRHDVVLPNRLIFTSPCKLRCQGEPGDVIETVFIFDFLKAFGFQLFVLWHLIQV